MHDERGGHWPFLVVRHGKVYSRFAHETEKIAETGKSELRRLSIGKKRTGKPRKSGGCHLKVNYLREGRSETSEVQPAQILEVVEQPCPDDNSG